MGPWFYFCAIAVVAFLSSYAARHVLRRFEVFAAIGSRSSHVNAAVTGGGFAIVIVVLSACFAIDFSLGFGGNFAAAYIPSALILALAGLWDDCIDFRISVRLAVYSLACIWVIFWLGPVDAFTIPGYAIDLSYAGYPLTFLFMLWMANLFNFMDGIDGLVAGISAFIGLGSFFLIANSAFGLLFLTIAAACIGFLPWNFVRLKLFLGDSGAIFLGFSFATILVAFADSSDFVAAVLVLLIPLNIDATMTLLVRLFRKQNVFQAHNHHLYQRLSRRFRSHIKITCSYLVFWFVVCLPLALVCVFLNWSSSLVLHASYLGCCVLWAFLYRLVPE